MRRPVALAILTFLLALALKLRPKDALVRRGEWGRKTDYMGEMLTGRVLGSLGLGGIGRELFRLAAPLEMRHLAHEDFWDQEGSAGSPDRLAGRHRQGLGRASLEDYSRRVSGLLAGYQCPAPRARLHA